MERLGTIVRLQVQLDSIKTQGAVHEQYTPYPNLTSVPVLHLTADGVQGETAAGEMLPDVHHRTHPHSKFRGDNGVSIMFTGHYAALRERFGAHLCDGIAGESILIERDGIVPLEMVAGGVVIVGPDREIPIAPWDVAHPCSPFSKFCLDIPAESTPDRRVTETLQFLEHGMRGFTAVYAADLGTAEIHIGDVVYGVTA
jgi:hypothetical protein